VRKNYFDEPVARRYDADSADRFDPSVVEPAVSFLAGLAGQGPRPAAGPKGSALEFGIGTGRIALPLSRRGIGVHGIDLSPDMVAQLKAKPGGDAIEVTIGDFATAAVHQAFSLAYLVYNTIENLTSQDDQVACFRNAAAHLAPGGFFVIEVEIPQLQRLPPGETVRPFTVTASHLGFDEYDIARQGLISHHYWVQDGEFRTLSMPFRYVWPAELDLMARLAGMSLRERWSGWQREPFTSDSVSHVSVWQKDA
jgi:SAM-dependent methyltransferase